MTGGGKNTKIPEATQETTRYSYRDKMIAMFTAMMETSNSKWMRKYLKKLIKRYKK